MTYFQGNNKVNFVKSFVYNHVDMYKKKYNTGAYKTKQAKNRHCSILLYIEK